MPTHEDKFKEIRKRLHLTQQKFAEGIEVEKSHIGQIETGKRQPEAIGLYKKKGYKLIPNYGQYAGTENSLCFEKEIK